MSEEQKDLEKKSWGYGKTGSPDKDDPPPGWIYPKEEDDPPKKNQEEKYPEDEDE